MAVHGTHGRRVPDGLGLLLGVVRVREGAGVVVGRGVGLARPRDGLLHRGGRAAWRQEPCSLAMVVITAATRGAPEMI